MSQRTKGLAVAICVGSHLGLGRFFHDFLSLGEIPGTLQLAFSGIVLSATVYRHLIQRNRRLLQLDQECRDQIRNKWVAEPAATAKSANIDDCHRGYYFD
jgi:hypothetical protein